MDREETKKIIRVIVSSYPNYKPDNITDLIDVWTMMLSEYSYERVAIALKTFIMSDTSGFAPSIGQLVNCLQKIELANELSETQAWEMVSKALRNSTYNADKEFNKLPPVVQKVVGSPSQLRNWAQTSVESVENVIQSNFMRSYRSVVNREKEIQRMPTEVKNLIEATTGKIALIEEEHNGGKTG